MSSIEDNDPTAIKRGPGRPRTEQAPQTLSASPEKAPMSTAPAKKGNPSWKPANVVDVLNKDPGFRYRLIRKDDRNIAKKKQEGWEILSGLNAGGTEAQAGYGRINEGKPNSSVLEGHDYVVGRLPEEIGKQRDEYFNGETDRRTKALYRNAKKDVGDAKGDLHGSITIERKGVRTVISE